MDRMVTKKIALIVPYGWLSVSPSLVSAIRLLFEIGYTIYVIYLYDEKFGAFDSKMKNVHMYPILPFRNKYLRLFNFFFNSLKIIIKTRCDVVIGVDQEGIIVAGISSIITKTPFIYYSLEILTKEEINRKKGIKKTLLFFKKKLESYFSRRAKLVIVQDEYRANILVMENAIEMTKVVNVPNSYYPFLKENNNITDNIKILFQIPTNKEIIIYTGSIIPEMAIKEMIEQVKSFPTNSIVILHTPYATDYLQFIKEYIAQHNLQNKVIISLKKLDFDELKLLIGKAKIGISLYKPVNPNFALCPSGKLSLYLSQGVPVITNTHPKYKEIIGKWKCGLYINSFEELGSAVRYILSNHQQFSLNARKCYEEELEFSKYFLKIVELINKGL